MTDRGEVENPEIAALAAAMRALSLAPGREATVEAESAQLLLDSLLVAVHDAPRLQPLGPLGVKRELQKTQQLAYELSEHINSLHKTTLLALAAGGQRRHPPQIRQDLLSLIEAADVALKEVAANPPPRVRGPRPKRQAADVTARAAACFERLTGRPAGRSVDQGREGGRFLAFLTAVFDALGIKASPAWQIAAMEIMPPR